jgi:signal transduction histidine kinase
MLGLLMSYLMTLTNLLTIFHPVHERYFPGMSHQHVPLIIIFIMLVVIAALPLKPFQTLGLGITLIATYLVIAYQSGQIEGLKGFTVLHLFMVVLAVLICTVLTALLYRQRASAHKALRLAEESFDELKQAQASLLISKNAASQGRLAAALSHELNSPLGALTSAVNTLLQASRKARFHPDEQERMRDVFVNAAEAANQSSSRLSETVERMTQISNLDRSEFQEVNLNELWRSTVELLRAELEPKAELRLDLKPLPFMRCRPQQMSAVFSNLLRNAAAAIDSKGTISIRSKQLEKEVLLEVRDDGRGIPADRLAGLFDPAFAVHGRRVSTTNWGLFLSRSIIAEHGGQIEIESTEGKGTTAKIRLPI